MPSLRTRPLSATLLFIALLGRGAAGQDPPRFRVDPFWPLELPKDWVMGQVGGLAVDPQDHVWVLQRPGSDTEDELSASLSPPRSMCCFPAKPVLEFDSKGNLLQSWGGPGPGFDWPATEHGIHVDRDDNVWIGGNAPTDRHVLKFSRAGRFLLQIGHPSTDPMDSSRSDILGRPAGLDVDEKARELYVADGYGNRRIVVYDSETGAFKRMWGAYGAKPADLDPGAYAPAAPPAQQFRTVHCVHIAQDGFVYVCDRGNDRIQVFTKQGSFVKEFVLRGETLGMGSVWDLTFSDDKAQAFLLVADGSNNVLWTLRRSDGAVLGQTGHAGRNAGQFHWVHQLGSDSAGNLYTGEVDTGKRIQKFLPGKD